MDFGHNCYDPLIAIGIAPNNAKHIYVAIENINDPDPSEFFLYKTTTGGIDYTCTSGCWTDITPANPDPNYITGIAVSPYNEDEIWISCSGYTATNKVRYYNGSTWSDYSYGLPEVPVNNIIYDHGSFDGLYVATDIGVYYRDKFMNQWEAYMDGLPNVVVSEIEINYKFNTIKAGTYGRGLWESPIPCNYVSTSDIEISSDQTWNVPMSMEGDVVVKTGYTLTIGPNANIYFPEDAKLVVERGAHLIVDGGTLSSSCGDMWKGIEVWGTSTATQNITNQGWVEFTNGGTIEDALIGIRTIKVESNGSNNYSYTGGIVQCDNSFFVNCQVATCFYKYPASPYTYTSYSGFGNCTFETTDDYIGPNDPTYFAKMYEINGIDYSNCTFVNSSSDDYFGRGIYSYKSDVNIIGVCASASSPCSSWDYGTFENLNYGIFSSDIESTRNIEIDRIEFLDNYRAVYISGTTDPVVINCNFEINSGYSPVGGYGLYLNSCTGYEVEENNFYHEDDQTETGIGIIVNNSGSEANEIYKNWFTGLELGISAQQLNRNTSNSLGLQLICNDFDDCDADILVPDPTYSNWGIASNQGTYNDPPSSEDMAGNIFYYNTTPNDYDDLNNEGNTFNYFYAASSSGYDTDPQDFTSSTVNVTQVYGITWDYDYDCPSNQTTGGGGGERESLLSSLSSTNYELEETESTLQALVDGGDTEALDNEVVTSTPPEAVDVYTELMNESPYLSNTVVESSIEKEDVLPNAMVRDIMVDNPQTAKADDLLDKLDDRTTPMPNYMKAQILAGRSVVSPKEKLESQVAAYKLKKMKTINALVRYYFSTESSWDIAADSVLVLLQQDNELQSKYRLAMLHLEKGEDETGEDVLDDISSQFDLTNEELAAHQNWIAFYDLMVGLENSNITLDNLTAGQIETITTIYENTEGVASSWARDMLQAMGEITYEEPILMENLLKSSDEIEAYNAILETEPPSQVSVYPNPTNGYLIVEYDLEGKQTGTIEISDMTGKLMDKRVVNQTKDQLTFVVKEWKTGTYIVSMKNDGKLIESCKFTIVK